MYHIYSTPQRFLLVLTLSMLMLCVPNVKKTYASIGDTLVVQAHNNVHMSAHGNYNAWAFFPSDTFHFSKIIMKYTLGCASTGCAAYDYTTQVFALRPSGVFDSTLTQYPSFTSAGATIDSVLFNTDTVYTYFFNTATTGTDSSIATTFQIIIFGDTLNPGIATDTMQVFPGNFYNHIYSSTGTVIDSIYVPYDSLWYVSYTNVYSVPFEIRDLMELGRVMTPFGNLLPASWRNDYQFDVTDYKPMFHDSLEMQIFFDGWANGYNVSVTFYMIEGIPPRDVKRVRILYPDNYYRYGFSSDPIESHLVPVTFGVDPTETAALLRVIPSGHSFGGALDCAEFCDKSYHVLINDTTRYNQHVWRSDCGMNPMMHQGGTWIYDRSNWCPGSKTYTKEHELTPFITPGDSVKVDMNFDNYVYTGGAGFDPGYILTANLITFGDPNFSLDATVDEILAPNSDFNYSRFNPICNHPQIVIRNLGSTPLTSCTIKYGIKGGIVQTYNWSGSLNFLDRATVQLDSMTWGSITGTPDIFEACVSNPNGSSDQYSLNDTMRSRVNFTPMLPQQFRLQWRTNSAANETSYKLLNDQGVILYQSPSPLTANTVYLDTFNLAPGCYVFRLDDSDKDGLSFFANSDGAGLARLIRINGPQVIKSFEADFGTQINFNFTVGFMTDVEEQSIEQPLFDLFPNPARENVTVSIALPRTGDIKLSVTNILGRTVSQKYFSNFNQQIIDLDLSTQPAGMYFVSLQTATHFITRKLLIE